MTRLRADLLLLLNAFIWGVAFIAQKKANDSMGPVTFVGLRYVVSAVLLLPLAILETGQRPRLSWKDFAFGALIGVLLFASMTCQQVGLLSTTATNAGFLTSLYVVIVPYVAWVIIRQRPDVEHVVACLASAFGTWLLATNGTIQDINPGDTLIIISSFGWAVWIVLVSSYMSRSNRPFFLASLQFFVTALLALPLGLLTEKVTAAGVADSLGPILFAGIASGAVATTLQGIAQKYTPATDAALIISLESVFAATAAYLLLGEKTAPVAMIGCVLIMASVVLVEAPSLVLRSRAQRDARRP